MEVINVDKILVFEKTFIIEEDENSIKIKN